MPLPYSIPLVLGEDIDHAAPSAAYAQALKLLLPRGILWLLDVGGLIDLTLTAISDELSRVDARGVDLVMESDPRTATETIEDWEKMAGLPDDLVVEIPATLAERRLAVTQKLVSLGGQTDAFYIALAAACGYVVTISNYGATLPHSGVFRSGHYLHGARFGYSMLVTVTAPAGDALTHAQLEAVIRHASQSHTVVGFVYL